MKEKKADGFDHSQVRAMLFQFDHNPVFLKRPLPRLEIERQVAKNLGEWGYQIRTDPAESVSHILSIKMGKMKRASTPAGFSFSIGNSDPRAIDFQKADIIPLSCFLKPADRSGESGARLDATVNAAAYQPYVRQSTAPKKLITRLVNDISTVCFNLLHNLNINTLPQTNSNDSTKKPGWFPEIRMEVENNPATETESPAQNSDNRGSVNDLRTRIIIHNQGSPVIFKFGHDRQ